MKYQNGLRAGSRDVAARALLGFQLTTWYLVGWCTVQWSRSLLKMVMLGQFLCIPWNFEIIHYRLGAGRWNWENHFTAWNMVAWCSLPWRRSLYEMADVRIFLFRPAKGAVVPWTSCFFKSNYSSDSCLVFVQNRWMCTHPVGHHSINTPYCTFAWPDVFCRRPFFREVIWTCGGKVCHG